MMTIKQEQRPDIKTILIQPIMKKKILIYIKYLLNKLHSTDNNYVVTKVTSASIF